jgi:hypothetical protein
MEEKQKKKESQKQKANTKKKANRYITEKNHHD